MSNKQIKVLNILILLVSMLLIITSLLGLLCNQGKGPQSALTLDGRDVELYGYGAYSNHSLVRATTFKGADLTIILIVVPMLIFTTLLKKKYPKLSLIQSGALMLALYYSISLAFGAAFNNFFLIYTVLFSLSLFTFVLSVYLISKKSWSKNNNKYKNIGTSLFLFIAGGSALIWLGLIIPALATGDYSEFIDLNTTEPTFVLDIGLIFPFFVFCAAGLLKKKELSYRFTPVLLTFYTLVGLMVIFQALFQNYYGIYMPKQQFMTLIVSFAVLGLISLIVNINFTKNRIQAAH